jgi:hypothetical protein
MHVVLPNNAARAKQQLHDFFSDAQAVPAVVFGRTPRAKQITALAELRAEGHVERAVFVLPAASLLKGDASFDGIVSAGAAGAEVVFVTLACEVAKQLQGVEALRAALHEEGFAMALAGELE